MRGWTALVLLLASLASFIHTGDSSTTSKYRYKPLVSLVMIVKDEAEGIEETLRSALPFVDRYTILDTGSTDGTQALIAKVAQELGVQGRVFQEPFVDFSTSRNRALVLDGEQAHFQLMIDADWICEGDTDLFRMEVGGHVFSDTPLYGVEMRLEDSFFRADRLIRSAAGLRFALPVHETIIETSEHSISHGALHISYKPRQKSKKKTQERAKWDLEQLQLAYQEQSIHHPRVTYYLAQTLAVLATANSTHLDQALERYLERAEMEDTWVEERYMSYYSAADILINYPAHPNSTEQMIISLCHKAYELIPERADAPLLLAHHYRTEHRFALCGLYSLLAFEGVASQKLGHLFVQNTVSSRADIHCHCAWYAHAFQSGLRACRLAMEEAKRTAKESDVLRLQYNMWYYLDQLELEIPKGITAAKERYEQIQSEVDADNDDESRD
eukprot:m.143076 g.143076  ORF g.143076 m.143076 type:complete len:443 (+) comp16007_c0_seq7:83-1411(+)